MLEEFVHASQSFRPKCCIIASGDIAISIWYSTNREKKCISYIIAQSQTPYILMSKSRKRNKALRFDVFSFFNTNSDR